MSSSIIQNGKFPVLGTKPQEYIPHEVLIPHEKQAIINHGQTLQTLAERGGLTWYEIIKILKDEKWSTEDIINDKEYKKKVWQHVLKFYNYQI